MTDFVSFFEGSPFVEQMEFLLRLILACILGMGIGFERKNRNKIAGVRTHAIVAFGAALMMIVSKYGFEDLNGSYDASRIAAQIVSGVGFLGAGVIFVKDKNSISGLTTAAGLWATAGVGMSIGAGLYFISVCSTLLLVAMQEILHRVSFLSNENLRTNVKLTIDHTLDIHELVQMVENENVTLLSLNIIRGNESTRKIELDVLFDPKFDKIQFFDHLITYPGVMTLGE